MELRMLLEAQKTALENELERINWLAGEVTMEYQDFHMAENKKRTNWDEKSVVTLRTKRRATSIGIWWVKLKWVGTTGKRQCFTREFPKRRGQHRYDLTEVLEAAQEWEREKIREIEIRAANVRLMASVVSEQLVRVNAGIRTLEKHEEAGNAVGV